MIIDVKEACMLNLITNSLTISLTLYIFMLLKSEEELIEGASGLKT